MKIGVPKEVKNHEYRVGLSPASVSELARAGHEILVAEGAGMGSGSTDQDYQAAGARLVVSNKDVFAAAELLVKVKEPQPEECLQMQAGQILFTYLHLAAAAEQASLLMAKGVAAIAYETVKTPAGALPLLTPMSEIAGRLSVQAGVNFLQKANGGSGVLLSGVPGVAPGRVTIVGGGVVGENAAAMALGLGAEVTLLDISPERLRELSQRYGARLKCLFSDTENLSRSISNSDLVVGAVLIPGAAAPRLITRELISGMPAGSVIVDVAIDQGGCAETSRPTTHDAPTYVVDDVVHYCVTNMPGAVPKTATAALNFVTLPYVKKLADHGLAALEIDPALAQGLNIHDGKIVNPNVAAALPELARREAA
ncbi:MAG: alanine dehydrogenase [Pseudomonadota bacterium]